ncbi:hypothetical protein [Pedobacter mucosus]|uniref:hypothetical protein n=1 Tax=Pedobacter mucosus TaxID=2895286 RepID=UPI001EE42E70|nr:hypothetical protein [Pedobacter mucosus]UKT65795.1 hypothetical protein LOK61_08385 [Pedobacter mucosus]
MLKKQIFVFFCIIFSLSNGVNAQVAKIDSLAFNLQNYAAQKKETVLFIHLDKNVYTNNDQVWFTGYILKPLVSLNNYNTLYLSLVSNADSSIILQQKFLINKGFAFGNLTLPDSLLSGAYKFVAHTNIKINGKPDAEFIQPIIIKSTTINPLQTSLTLFKSNDGQTGNGTVLLRAITSNNRFVPDAAVNYTIGRNSKFVKTGKAKTSIIGEIMIDYPVAKINKENNLLTVTVKKDKHIRFEQFEIPLGKEYKVNFYPEGGYLISNIQNRVGWEVKDEQGAAISARAVLFGDGKILDTIITNSTGLGSFLIKPELNVKYAVRLLKEGKMIGNYPLPAHLIKGINIKLNAAVGNNEIIMFVEGNLNSKAHLIVHNYQDIYLSSDLVLKQNKPLKVSLKLDSVPKGINTITLLDSLYRPVAERIFFAHYDDINRIDISTDKTEYSTRDSIQLKLKIFDKNQSELKGIVSVAFVQSNRLSVADKMNIVDYAYLENDIGELPPNPSGIKYDDKLFLEDILLIKGWRKFKWPEEKDVYKLNNVTTQFEYSGHITKGKKALKAPLGVNTIAVNNINSLNTDSTGKFILPYQALLIEPKSAVWLSLSSKNFYAYNVKINDPFDEIKSSLKTLTYQKKSGKMGILAPEIEDITSLSGIRLNEVTIKKSKDNNVGFAAFGRNACGDYVCQYGILNCPNHSSGTMPVSGRSYISNGSRTIYQGCLDQADKPNIFILHGISYPKEFYVADIKNKNEPIDFATTYWNYQYIINKNVQNSLTFTSGDLTGEFKIVIQGITEKGVVYGEKLVNIKRQ